MENSLSLSLPLSCFATKIIIVMTRIYFGKAVKTRNSQKNENRNHRISESLWGRSSGSEQTPFCFHFARARIDWIVIIKQNLSNVQGVNQCSVGQSIWGGGPSSSQSVDLDSLCILTNLRLFFLPKSVCVCVCLHAKQSLTRTKTRAKGHKNC